MCHLCGWLKLFLKSVRWEKIKIQKRSLLGRLSVGSFGPLIYVYFCRSFLLCRLLRLPPTTHHSPIPPISLIAEVHVVQGTLDLVAALAGDPG